MMRHLPVAGLVMASLIGFAALLRAIGGGPPPDVPPLSLTEQQFLARAAQACAAEGALAKLVGSRTQNQRVKALALAVARDHEATKNDLAEIAKKMDVTLPEPSVAQNAARERVAGLRGAEFDRAWVWQTAKNHAAAVALFRDGARGANTDLTALAERTLGMLATHLNGARELDHSLVARLGPNPARSQR